MISYGTGIERFNCINNLLMYQVITLETAISEKKRQVERLVSDMKEANLQSLAAAPPEELKLLLEGNYISSFLISNLLLISIQSSYLLLTSLFFFLFFLVMRISK